MKKLFKTLIVLTAISVSVFTSCKKDPTPVVESEAPTLKINNGIAADTKSASVDSIRLDILASAATDRKIKKLVVTRAITGTATATIDSTTYNAKDVIVTIYDVIKSFPNITLNDGDAITYTVIVTDDNSKSATANFVINIKTANTSPQIYLGGPASTLNDYRFYGVADNFQRYRVGTSGAFLAKDNSAKIDFIYYFNAGGAIQNALYSPDYFTTSGVGYNSETSMWAVKNHTVYILTDITSAQFDALQGQNFIDAFMSVDFALATTKVANLELSKVYAYRKGNGKRGLIKVGTLASDDKGQILLITKAEL